MNKQANITPGVTGLQAFKWHDIADGTASALSGAQVADFASAALDVARGVRAIEELIERSEIDRDFEGLDGRQLPTLSAQQASDLRRLALCALDTLQARAAEVVRQANADAGSMPAVN